MVNEVIRTVLKGLVSLGILTEDALFRSGRAAQPAPVAGLPCANRSTAHDVKPDTHHPDVRMPRGQKTARHSCSVLMIGR
jgi:hypothetical protein